MSRIKKFDDLNEAVQSQQESGKIELKLSDIDESKLCGGKGNFTIKGHDGVFMYDINQQWGVSKFNYNGSEYTIIPLYFKEGSYKSVFGYTVLKGGELEYLVSIYEPNASLFNGNNISFVGHEEMGNINLETGVYKRVYTR